MKETHEFTDDFIDPDYDCPECHSKPPFCPECKELKDWIKSQNRKKRLKNKEF